MRLMPYTPACTSTCDIPSNYGNTTIHGIMVHKHLKAFDSAIDNVCKATLHPHCYSQRRQPVKTKTQELLDVQVESC